MNDSSRRVYPNVMLHSYIPYVCMPMPRSLAPGHSAGPSAPHLAPAPRYTPPSPSAPRPQPPGRASPPCGPTRRSSSWPRKKSSYKDLERPKGQGCGWSTEATREPKCRNPLEIHPKCKANAWSCLRDPCNTLRSRLLSLAKAHEPQRHSLRSTPA